MIKLRSVYLLHRDGRVTKHKKSIEKLKAAGLLVGVQYVLLPVASKKAVYLAVLGDFLNAETFHKTTVRMHMQLMGASVPTYQDFPPWVVNQQLMFDYWTTTMEANSWEEFYHILHIAMTNCVVEYLQQNTLTSHGTSHGYSGPAYFHRIQDLSIRCLNKEGQDITDPFEHHMNDVGYPDEIVDHLDGPPIFDEYTSGNADLLENLAERFGLYQANGRQDLMSIREDDDGNLVWRMEHGTLNLFSNVKKVIFGTGDYVSPLIMLTDDEYDQIIRLEMADAYVIPLIYAPDDYESQKPPYDMLTPTTYFGIPRYEFSDDNDSPYAIQNALMLMESYMGETLCSYESHDSQHAAFMVAYMKELLETLCEATKVEAAERIQCNDLLGLSNWCTNMVDLVVEISEANPSTKYLHIATDRYQDVPLDIKTVCYLLEEEEKQHK